MNFAEFKDKLREKRDVIILLLIVAIVLLSIVIGVKMQKNYGTRKRAEEEALRPPEKVTLAPSQQQAANGAQRTRQSSGGAYFLKPSAEELLTLIRESGQAQLPRDNQKYVGFRVMWPCYFFQVLKQEGNRATVLLDVSEDGFGATILTDIDLKLFPEIVNTERGHKVWIAGEIIGVDPTGTGTIHIVTEEVRFQEGLLDAVRGAVNGRDVSTQQSGPSQ